MRCCVGVCVCESMRRVMWEGAHTMLHISSLEKSSHELAPSSPGEFGDQFCQVVRLGDKLLFPQRHCSSVSLL